ncbi:hypothetical protein CHS0354_020218 [Potamilus streckersoni]|uniref:Uncharacterized protein n=1 Tax=Potamilus streckersoni TaxID=2493646 RepID=A0AAE0SL74_9BIVA|nr:hypothetical protein CHS0354_020218 [Potamilus streckersoni]
MDITSLKKQKVEKSMPSSSNARSKAAPHLNSETGRYVLLQNTYVVLGAYKANVRKIYR